MNVTWGSSGPGTSIQNFLPALTSRGLYTMVSQLTLPASQCPEGANQRCQVRDHSSAIQTMDVPCKVKTPTCSNCQPRLTLSPPAIEDLLLGSSANLTCTLSGLRKPQGASFTWNPTGGKDAIQEAPQRDACGCYSVSSVLPGCAEPWNRGQRFTCTATHPEAKSQLTATIARASVQTQPCLKCCEPRLTLRPPALEDLLLGSNASLTCTLSGLQKPQGASFSWNPTGGKDAIQEAPQRNTFPPQVHLLPPPTEELALNELVTLTCVVRGFYPGDVLVQWRHENQELPRGKYQTWSPLPEAGQGSATFATTSVLRVDAEAWKNGDNYSCVVGHEALPLSFTQKTINRLAGNTFPPQVHLLPPPTEELALNELVTLTCVVRGFYPGDVLVQWRHENQELPRGKYQTWSPLPEAGQGSATFATTSVLRVDAEACMVGHEALPLSFTQKTINRLAGKPTHVNVSVVLSEVDGTCY
ncbi:Ig alpha chain C region [Myotis davidii]|uniref:Ig alpha chain C region n=1 Tax=Myotis davidii TaxID=225400 RepID=L5MGS9_MYODS|nr:Ig alpha chain C region [Myotis davidii]